MSFQHNIGNTALEVALSHLHKDRTLFLLLQQTVIPREPIGNSYKALAAMNKGKPLSEPCLSCHLWVCRARHCTAGAGREERALWARSGKAGCSFSAAAPMFQLPSPSQGDGPPPDPEAHLRHRAAMQV